MADNFFVTTQKLGEFRKAYNEALKSEDPKAAFETLFNDVQGVKDDVKADHTVNKEDISNILKAIKKAASNTEKSEEKAKNLRKEGATFGDKKVKKGSVKVSGNVVTFKCEDGSQVSIKYAKDGSHETTITKGNETTTKVVDANGKVRQKTVENSKTGEKTVSEYDATGTINKKVTTNTKDPNIKTTIMYDDNGKAVYKVAKDGVTTTKTSYEYNNKGERIGAYTEKTNNITGEVTRATSIIEGNKKTVTRVFPDGKTFVTHYNKTKDGDWEIDNRTITKPGEDKPTEKDYSDVKPGEKGTTTRNVKVVVDGKEFYDTETLNADGKLIGRERYADEAKTKLVSKTVIKYDDKGYKTSETITRFDDAGKELEKVKTTYDPTTGFKKQKVVTNKQTGDVTTSEYDEKTGKIKSKKFENKKGEPLETRSYDKDGKLQERVVYTREGGKLTMVQTIKADGSVTTTTYNEGVPARAQYHDATGKLLTSDELDAEGNSVSAEVFSYDADNNFTSSTITENGRLVRMRFPTTDTNVIEGRLPDKSEPNTNIEILAPNGVKIGTAVFDGEGNRTTVLWESNIEELSGQPGDGVLNKPEVKEEAEEAPVEDTSDEQEPEEKPDPPENVE